MMTRSKHAGETSSQSPNGNSLKRSRHPSPDKSANRNEKPKRRKSDEEDWIHVEKHESSALSPEPRSATQKENVKPQSAIFDPPRVFAVPEASDTSSGYSDAETVIPRGSGNPFEHATINAVPRPRLPGQRSELSMKRTNAVPTTRLPGQRSEVLMNGINPGMRFRHQGRDDDGYYTTGPARLVWGKTEGPLAVCLPLTSDVVEGFQTIIQTQRFLKTVTTKVKELETKEENLDDDLVTGAVVVAELAELACLHGQQGRDSIKAMHQKANEEMVKTRREKTTVGAQKDGFQKSLLEWQNSLSVMQLKFNAILENAFIGADLVLSEEEEAEKIRREELQKEQRLAQDPTRAEKVQTAKYLLALRKQLDDAQLAFWQRRPAFHQRQAEYIENNLHRPTDLVKEEFCVRDLKADMDLTCKIVQLENCLHQEQERALDKGISFDDGMFPLPQENDGDAALHSDDYAMNEDLIERYLKRLDRAWIHRWLHKTDPDYDEPPKKSKMKLPQTDDVRLSYERLEDVQVGECWEDSWVYETNDPTKLYVEIWKKKMNTEGEARGVNQPVLQKQHEDGDENDDC